MLSWDLILLLAACGVDYMLDRISVRASRHSFIHPMKEMFPFEQMIHEVGTHEITRAASYDSRGTMLAFAIFLPLRNKLILVSAETIKHEGCVCVCTCACVHTYMHFMCVFSVYLYMYVCVFMKARDNAIFILSFDTGSLTEYESH